MIGSYLTWTFARHFRSPAVVVGICCDYGRPLHASSSLSADLSDLTVEAGIISTPSPHRTAFSNAARPRGPKE